MDRRNFLRQTGLLSIGIPLITAIPAFGRETRSGTLRFLTDQADRVSSEVGGLLELIGVGQGSVSVSTSIVPGTHLGDLVLTDGGRLVDYHTADRKLAEHMRQVADRMALPRPIDNPTLMTFRYGSLPDGNGQAIVYIDGQAAGRLDPRQNLQGLLIEGVGGQMRINITGGRVSVAETSCRHRTCMKMGHAAAPGDELLCIPTRIRIAIDGRNPFGLDAISR
jgi:hypothetical protein